MKKRFTPSGTELVRLYFSPFQKCCLIVSYNEAPPYEGETGYVFLLSDRIDLIEKFVISDESEKLYQYDRSTIGMAENVYFNWRDGGDFRNPWPFSDTKVPPVNLN